MVASYYNPGSNYGLAKDWKQGGFPTRPEFVRKVRGFDIPRAKQNEMIREFWGPGGQPAYRSPFGQALADQDPTGTFYRLLGQSGNFGPETQYGQHARNQFDEIFNAFRAAQQRNPLLRFEDFWNRGGISNLINQRYELMTPMQRGEIGPSLMQRWV
jgi:hypothetical protein